MKLEKSMKQAGDVGLPHLDADMLDVEAGTSDTEQQRYKIEKRKYGWFVQRSYQYDTHDVNGIQTRQITHDEWKQEILDQWQGVHPKIAVLEYIAIAFHDRDKNEDGTGKGLHVHAVIKYADAKNQSAVMEHFGLSLRSNCQFIRNYTDAARYLCHASESALNKKKYLYSRDIVYMTDYGTKANPKRQLDISDLMAANEDRKAKSKTVESMIELYCPRLRAGEEKLADVQRLFLAECGEIAWKEKKSTFENAFEEYRQAMYEKYVVNREPRNLKTVYIFGDGGNGKSQLGDELTYLHADILGVHQVAVPGRKTTFDFAGNYKGERASIMDEVRTGMTVDQFCDSFDPRRVKVANCRNEDKAWFSQFVVLTQSETLEKFITQLLYYSGAEFQDVTAKKGDERLNTNPRTLNKAGQVRRRITFYLVIESDDAGTWVNVYGLVYKFRDKCFPYSHMPLGRIPYNDVMADKKGVAEKIKGLIDKHDPLDPAHDNYAPNLPPQSNIPAGQSVGIRVCPYELGLR